MKKYMSITVVFLMCFSGLTGLTISAMAETADDYQATPPFLTAGVPPLVMLVMGRNHKLYYEAYNDASDLNDDGVLDVGYNPEIDYYGYFDCYKCYTYDSGNDRFNPSSTTADKKCSGANEWSGDFLNYLTMSRMDCLRKVLYGGYRSTDTNSLTVLERAYIPQDAHSWGKEYYSVAHDGYDISDYTPLSLPQGGTRHLFANTTLSDAGDPLLRVLENSVLRIWEWVAIERPVAGSEGNDGSGRRSVTDNNVSGEVIDVTDGGDAGTADDSYSADGTTISDDFEDGVIDAMWTWADHDGDDNTSHSETGGNLVIDADGADVWTGDDEFCSLYMDDVSGDFDIKVKITSQEEAHEWSKGGIMVRNDMTDAGNSTGYCMIATTPGNGYSFQWDSDNNGYLDGNTEKSSVSTPTWVRLKKEGTTFTGYYGSDGESWTLVESKTLGSANAAQDLGLFVTSHNSGTLSECKFDYMEMSAPEPDPELAFDDDGDTKWVYPDEPTYAEPVWIQFQFSSAKEILSYSITPGSDPPEDWEFQGSNDGSSWTTLHTVLDAGLAAGTKESFDCSTTGEYTYYRFYIKDSGGGTDGVDIAEITMSETKDPPPATATLTDYEVRVKVCDSSVGLEPNSRLYPDGNYKPIGILQRHGEAERMYFGLLSGSYTKNTSGGVLRKNISSIKDEIKWDSTGEFEYIDDSSVDGIIKTIDMFRVVDFNYSSHSYDSNCGWIADRPINEGECRMWGNPIAEMMYETLRYFSGEENPTASFDYTGSDNAAGTALALPKPSWEDPYDSSNCYDYCAKPFMLVLSDIYPTHDSDQVPGSYFGSMGTETIGAASYALDVESLADAIFSEEETAGTYFIGQSGSDNDHSCSPKSVDGFGDICGLCPEEPTKKGGYYAAAVSYYGRTEDMSSATDDQNVVSYMVGLASPLPRINIQVGDNTIILVPFGKSVGGGYGISATEGDFQPTNTIVDFFVEEITSTYGKFRINYEDVEQGADHDMDAIVEYTYRVVDQNGNPVDDPADGEKVEITLNSTYAAGGIIQHLGYIISGTTEDGTYLEVRDEDTSSGSDVDYFLDTPPGVTPPATSSEWDDDSALPLTTTRTFTPGTSTTADYLENPLWYAAKWGGFEEDSYDSNDKPDQTKEWDEDGDSLPDTYFYVTNPLRLEEQLNRSFADILRRTSSGTAASVISNTRSGEGAIFQSIFFPEFRGISGNIASWCGEVHALLVDEYGNMREDTNQNHALDLVDDKIIVFDETSVLKYGDSDGDCQIDDESSPDEIGDLMDIEYLWSSSEWLNEIPDSAIDDQRYPYASTDQERYIITFVDSDNDMIVDSNEQVDFECQTLPAAGDLTDTSKIFPYLTLYPSFEDEPADITALRTDGNFEDFAVNQTQRLINYIRGKDQDIFTSSTDPVYMLPEFRTRKVDYDEDSTVETWRLGDIIYSTPSSVTRPSENYHLIYKDTSYGEFYKAYQHRRGVVYSGGNDGMLHAFNAGFYDSDNRKFVKQLNGETEFELGAELWAYIPYNLLPHLYWLAEPEYAHVYYCDLKPKIFDAKIFTPDDTHPSGWGTVLVGGMRFGGGKIRADMDKTDGIYDSSTDRTMTSAFYVLDITDPEAPPDVLAELSFDGLGYTTCYPAVAILKDKDPETKVIQENEWYLVIGSGPADAGGSPESTALAGSVSAQKGRIYVVDLNELVQGNIVTLDSTGSNSGVVYTELDDNSFISDPSAVDFDLDFNAEAIYFGTVSGDAANGWGGKLRRIVLYDDPDTAGNEALAPANWTWDSTLLDLSPDPSGLTNGQPIVAAPNVAVGDYVTAISEERNRWVFFGTGRFFTRGDAENADQQSYYGLKEPFDTDNNEWTWATVDRADLLDVANSEVYTDGAVAGITGVSDWDGLLEEIGNSDGWYIDFAENKERNLGQATLLGSLLTFTTYTPSVDPCQFEGETYLYATYYRTGTAYCESVIGTTDVTGETYKIVDKKTSLGEGLSVTPNIHVGMEEGSKAFVQTSTGDIKAIQQINPGRTKSGTSSWKEVE